MHASDFEFEQAGPIVTVRIMERDLAGPMMADLADQLTQRVRCDNARHVVLDMTHVQFISSDCLGPLVNLLQDLEHMHGRIAIASATPEVQFLFKVTKLDTIFQLCDDTDEARQSLAA